MTTITLKPRFNFDELQLYTLFNEALCRARRLNRPVLVSATQPALVSDSLALFAQGAAVAHERFFWSCPSEAYTLVGLGAAWFCEAYNAQRFADVASSWRDCCAHALIDPVPHPEGVAPLLMGGGAFDPACPTTSLWTDYPPARFVLPRFLFTQRNDAQWLTINAIIKPDSKPIPSVQTLLRDGAALTTAPSIDVHPLRPTGPLTVEDALTAEEWMAMIRAAVWQIQHGDLKKVVLARLCRIQGSQPFDPIVALARLRADYPACFHFAIARGARCFLGASPERLVRLRQGVVQTTSLAGSIGRGATEDEDRRLGVALLSSVKDRAEHAIVAQTLRSALEDLCVELTVPEAPTLMKMPNVQHLFTPITGRIATDRSILEFVERLHPTPALGGSPRDLALNWIREREKLDRGWYAGPVGWMDANGEGEFAVAIRSALLYGATASLFAGCGIVADSDPESEYAESRLKLRPLLTALGRSIQ